MTSVSVIIPSYSRRTVLHETVAGLQRQTLRPRRVIISVPDKHHVLAETLALPGSELVLSRPGSTAQRNAALDCLPPDSDLVAFLDDDIELADDYFERMAAMFGANADVVLANGAMVRDGARCGGISRDEAREALEKPPTAALAPGSPAWPLQELPSIYGCNMVARAAALDGVRFDERLLLYGWLEDLDFSHWCSRKGRVVLYSGARAAHLGASAGRVSGTRIGFSQIMNSLYLARKGSLTFKKMLLAYWLKPLASNLVLSVLGDAHIDRPGRLKGNLIALRLAASGTVRPEHILQLDAGTRPPAPES